MEKRFIVKSVVCDYGVFDTRYGNGECLDCICSARANADLIADILNTDYSKPNECTYYVNQLQQENKQLEEQLAEKDKQLKEKVAIRDESIKMLIKKLTIIQNITENENIIKLAEDCLNLVRIPYATYIINEMVNEKQAEENINEDRN